jgi:diguanylate cyclase (GGDEF)-like protein
LIALGHDRRATIRLQAEERHLMKITGPQGSTPAQPTRKLGAASSVAGAASAPAAVDPISIAGVPDAELTPRVRAALVTLLQEVAQLRKELADARARMADLETLASADPLLGILNRRAFVGELNRALAMIQRYSQPSSLLFVDLDNLKKINDQHGHAAGDAALKHASAIIAANIRQTDVFGRLGGDEFAIILTNTPQAGATQKAKALKELVAATPEPSGLPVSITCGVVEMTRAHTVEAALAAADRVMYEQKRNGRR